MSFQTHDLAEWAAVLSLSTGITASAFVPWLLLVDSVSARDFDPRPALARAIESGRVDPVLCAVANAKHDARAARDRARLALAAALLALALRLNSIPSAPQKGALR